MQSCSNIAASGHFVLGTLHSYLPQLAYRLRPVRLRKHDSSKYPNRTFVSPSPPADRGVIVQRINYALLAFVTFAAMLALSGCSDSKQISEVKALPFELINSIDLPQDLTVDQALDNRKVCDDIKWTTDKDNQGETIVTYRCDYKGVDDSLFVKNGGLDVKSAGDVYQWTYGRDDKPALTGVAAIINQKDGKSVDIAPGQSANYTIWLAFHNTAKNFDEAYSQLSGKAVPQPPEATKSASLIPDTTYGNKMAQFFPGQPAKDAVIHAYLQKGLPESLMSPYGIDSLGYLQLVDTPEARAAAYPVDPSDVQFALTMKPPTATGVGIGAPHGLLDNKLICLSSVCYNLSGRLVGKAPPEVVAKEVGGATIDGYGDIQPVAQTQPAAQTQQPVQAPSQPAMQQAVQQDANAQPATLGQLVAQATQPNAPASASTADPLPVGAEDWPTSTPCIKKLEDAYRKDRQAHGLDDTISMDQDNDFASTCKTVGQ